MISIARKNLASLFWNPNCNSFLCNSNAHSLLSIHLLSSSTSKLIPHFREFYDVLIRKHQFSSEFAYSLSSSHLPKSATPERTDSVLSLLKENSFTTSQLEKLIRYQPGILGHAIEDLQLKLNVFRDLGLTSEEIANMLSSNQAVLHSSLKHRIIPSLSILKGLLGSDHEVARLLRKSGWCLTHNLDTTLMPNVEILKSSGIPMERVIHLLYMCSRYFLIKPDVMRKSVDRAIKLGVPRTSAVFIQAVGVIAHLSPGMWEVKLQTFRDLGFSDDDMLIVFRRHPTVLSISPKKLESSMEIILGTGKYNISDIVTNPKSLACSIEKRLEPRLRILGLLESKNLIEKWPALGTVINYNDGQFFDKFVKPYFDEIGKEYSTKK